MLSTGDKVIWNHVGEGYSVYYGAEAKVCWVVGEDFVRVEWVREYENIELINGQLDGVYFIKNFKKIN
jgi:hypothetical protein